MTVTTFRWIDWLKGTETMEMKAKRRYHVALELTVDDMEELYLALKVAAESDWSSELTATFARDLVNTLNAELDLGYAPIGEDGR